MLGLALILFLISLLSCLIALWIARKSERIQFDFSADDLSAELRKLRYSLQGWLAIIFLLQGGSSLFLSLLFPLIWALSQPSS